MTSTFHLMRTMPWLAALAIVQVAGCGASVPPPADPAPPRALDPTACALDAYAPVIVEPHYDDVTRIKTTVSRLHGADVFIAARAGLTAEWLRVELAPRPDRARSCALGVGGAQVTVVSAGPGFRVTIWSPDERAAYEILQLARIDEAPARAPR